MTKQLTWGLKNAQYTSMQSTLKDTLNSVTQNPDNYAINFFLPVKL